MDVLLSINGVEVPIERDVFEALFLNSVVAARANVEKALGGEPLSFRSFLELARQAEIPYPLFFAPLDVVNEQVRLKNQKLMSGFTKDHFSIHSRQRVNLSDIELILKDLLRKQSLLRKHDRSLSINPIVGLLKKRRGTVAEEAELLLHALQLDRSAIRSARTKEGAVDVLIERLEAAQVLVSRSAKNFMPQTMPREARFSGITLKDKKVPMIFLATGEEGEHLEPSGRRLFTLTLLAVLVARDTFAPVNYNGHSKESGAPHEYDLTAEILMPQTEMRSTDVGDLDRIKAAADHFRVTPSAVAMRARRLGTLGQESFEAHMDTLRAEYSQRADTPKRSLLPINGLKRYNGIECSRRMLRLLDGGAMSAADFRRVMFSNKLPASQIRAYREAVS